MSTTTNETKPAPTLQTLPGDDVHAIMWRFADRYDIQMLVQGARSVARGPVARLVAEGERNSHDWTERKATLLKAFDEAGLTGAFMEPEQGGVVAGPKNLLLSLIVFELSWVDAGAATGCMAGDLALSPIHECGTPEQRDFYMKAACPTPGQKTWRGAFALTEPLPYVGVETGLLDGKVRVAEWKDGQEPILEVNKRGRFITNMGFANFVTAAVDTDDPKIKSSCMVILHEDDPGVWDRGTPTKKLVHQLSSTCDPVLNVKVPASRIIGGYTIKDGLIVPNMSHGEIIEKVFSHTRVTVAAMTAAKLLSAVEPIIRYQRSRFRGGEAAQPGSPRYDLGLQMKEDALHRLVDIWATGEAAASIAFEASRVFDQLDPLNKHREKIFEERKVSGPRATMKAMAAIEKEALEYLQLGQLPEAERGARYETLKNDLLVQQCLLSTQANVLCPGAKLWNTGHGANVMREAVSLMGGYGITEDCPGFLGQKWMDAQLEATYEGPEAVQRRQLSVTMTNDVFLAQYRLWMKQMRAIASERPGTGACTLATAMQMWLWTLEHLQEAKDADGRKLYSSNRQGVTFPLADVLCWLLAARQFILDVLELEAKGVENPTVAEALPGLKPFYNDLCHTFSARATGEVGRVCAELVFGYNRHPAWDDASCAACFASDDLGSFECIIPGIASSAPVYSDVTKPGQAHPAKAGPCVCFDGLEDFTTLRGRLDGCLTGARLAKDNAAEALTKVMIPEALDYPM
jgi:alkylation response protein AidB-like acyl-CoA dehydrogenase